MQFATKNNIFLLTIDKSFIFSIINFTHSKFHDSLDKEFNRPVFSEKDKDLP